MAATAQQQLAAANDSYLRILQSDTAEWSEGERRQRTLDLKELRESIAFLQGQVESQAGRRFLTPVTRVWN